MIQTHSLISSLLLSNLNIEINENEIRELILALDTEIAKIESVSGRSLHTIILRSKGEMLNEKLAYCKDRARICNRMPNKLSWKPCLHYN